MIITFLRYFNFGAIAVAEQTENIMNTGHSNPVTKDAPELMPATSSNQSFDNSEDINTSAPEVDHSFSAKEDGLFARTQILFEALRNYRHCFSIQKSI